MDADEAFARQLQQQFEKEERSLQQQEDKDLAMALSMGHAISDSEKEDSDGRESPSMFRSLTKSKNTNSNASASQDISDSDDTDVEEDAPPKMQKMKSPSKKTPSKKSPSKKQEKDEDMPSTSKGDTNKRKASSSKDEKPMCQYGSECFRRNKWHLEEFRHPEEDTPVSKKRKIESSKKRTTEDNARQSTSSSSSSVRSCTDVIQEASPLCFLMTKVSGISSQYNSTKAVHISDILSECMGELVESVQFNYMHDISWLVQQYPKKFRSKPLLLVHGEQREGKMRLHEEASAYSHIKLCQAKLEMMWGTHHSKMMLLLYTNGMRVVIHTANLIHQDWHQKSQGVWISPLFPKLSGSTEGSSIAGDSPSHFKSDLMEYLAAYKSKSLLDWIAHIKRHDMSNAKVHIIGSVPGRHIGEAKSKWGHMKMRRILKEHGPVSKDVSNWPVIAQFSSVGSLGPDKSKWLCAEFLQSMTATKGASASFVRDDNRMLKLIFPSRDNIRTSLEGYPAGGSVPYSIKTAMKQKYFNTFLQQWKARKRGRSRASPHIKTYSRLSPDSSSIPWFLVTSSNLSKAAWGALEKNASQLMIRSYEIGVLFLPQHFEPESKFFAVGEQTSSSDKQLEFPLPWDVPLVPYTKEDRPWIWDIPYFDKPDSHGNVWAPPPL
ncbi:tyrosyl-DNA phosphodiesterase 1-like [Amphiura filiformis]|uniref:tyrosyl-DNA phosphodiesterase 1-like n=1 Tax=Amphiura filiformis TaxID=82378 RepID=UPI003B2146E4